MTVGVFRMGSDSGWHWGTALAAARVPVAFTLFLGGIGLLIAGAYLAAIWRATT